jgi:ribonuclease VapC
MVIDSSALLAVLLNKPQASQLAEAMAKDPRRLTSSFSALETAVVIETKKGEGGGRELDLLLHRAQIEIAALDAGQFEIARRAYRQFGKGRHPAGLNIGDCCAYALSKSSGEPLLFIGEDFARTDVTAASF